jgi:arginase
MSVPITGSDIVEYNPTCAHHTQTAMVCAKFLKEIAAAMLRHGNLPCTEWV